MSARREARARQVAEGRSRPPGERPRVPAKWLRKPDPADVNEWVLPEEKPPAPWDVSGWDSGVWRWSTARERWRQARDAWAKRNGYTVAEMEEVRLMAAKERWTRERVC